MTGPTSVGAITDDLAKMLELIDKLLTQRLRFVNILAALAIPAMGAVFWQLYALNREVGELSAAVGEAAKNGDRAATSLETRISELQRAILALDVPRREAMRSAAPDSVRRR